MKNFAIAYALTLLIHLKVFIPAVLLGLLFGPEAFFGLHIATEIARHAFFAWLVLAD